VASWIEQAYSATADVTSYMCMAINDIQPMMINTLESRYGKRQRGQS